MNKKNYIEPINYNQNILFVRRHTHNTRSHSAQSQTGRVEGTNVLPINHLCAIKRKRSFTQLITRRGDF